MNRIFQIIGTLLLFGFMQVAGADNKLIAIEDYVVGADYAVVEVDGKPPERAKHGLFVTVTPLVLVTEGSHVLTLEKKAGAEQQNSGNESLSINVKMGKRYRLVRKNENPLLIEAL